MESMENRVWCYFRENKVNETEVNSVHFRNVVQDRTDLEKERSRLVIRAEGQELVVTEINERGGEHPKNRLE